MQSLRVEYVGTYMVPIKREIDRDRERARDRERERGRERERDRGMEGVIDGVRWVGVD